MLLANTGYPTTRDELERGVCNWLKRKVILVGQVRLRAEERGAQRGPCARGVRVGASPARPSQGAPQGPWGGRLRQGRPPGPAGATSMSLPACPRVEPRDSDSEGECTLK